MPPNAAAAPPAAAASAASTAASRRTSSASSRRHENEANPDLSLNSIGNYVFERTLGQGNFAKVKLAKHKLTGQEVAVKIIDKTPLDEKKLGKLHREVRIMKMLNHPNIVKLYEVIETRNTLFLVMEYVDGGELYDYLVAHGRMKEKEARAKFRQIVHAVSYCHKTRVIHRDLKAENLLLDSNLNIKIADFGFSNHYAPEGQLDTFCGSPPYAAPELFQGKKYTGPEVDVWSLGVILYVLCTGCLPFDGKDLKEMREVVCRGRYKVPFYLSDGCEKLLRKFLVRDPTKRASLDMLVDDVWLNEGYETPATVQDLPSDPNETPDEDICRFVTEKFNIPYDQIINSLRENNYDDVTAIYILLRDQKLSGKWTPLSSTGLSPMSPMQLQAGTATPISRPSNMGTIGEDADAVAPPTVNLKTPMPARVATRDRASTLAATATSRQRPTTWMATDNQAQKIIEEVNKNNAAATSSGRRLPADPTAVTQAATTILTEDPSDSPLTRASDGQGAGDKQAKNGVIGAIRSIGRRLSEATNNPAAPASPNGEEKPRAMRFTFNSNTTSSKNPDDIIKELNAACQKLKLKCISMNRFTIECTWYYKETPLSAMSTSGDHMDMETLQKALAEVTASASSVNGKNDNSSKDVLKFEVEVCELPRLKNLHALRFKRVTGPSQEYKDICGKLLQTIHL